MDETRYNEESEHGTVGAAPAPEHDPIAKDDLDMPSSKSSSKSPAYQFYPEAWFSSSKVRRMSHTEKGMYTDLLAYCWLENGLPTDVKLLAAMLGVPAARFGRIWSQGALHECFFERNGKLYNARQERERKKQAEFRKSKQDAAHMRWSHQRNADAMPSISISVSDRVSTSGKEEVSAEPPSDSSPAVLTFPTIGKGPKSWALTEAYLSELVSAYPGVDVRGECQRSLMWVKANGPKTAKGMPAFLVRWMNTATNRGGSRPVLAATGTEGRGRTGAPPAGKYAGIEEHD